MSSVLSRFRTCVLQLNLSKLSRQQALFSSPVSLTKQASGRAKIPASRSTAPVKLTPHEDLSYPELDRNMLELSRDGFTVVPDVFSPAQLQELKRDYALIHAKAEDIMRNTQARRRDMEENNSSIESQYWKVAATADTPEKLILQAGKGRYDLYKGFCTPEDGIFGTDSVVRPYVQNLVASLL